jgi:small subunit ribosomal protein S6
MAPETVYDLTLLLSTAAPEETRAKILSDLEGAIQSASGSIVGRSEWGTRNLTYRIDRQTEAEFHLFQITGPPSLLTDLGHTLRITDGVLRFRIIKAVPGSRVGGAAEQAATPAPASASSEPGAATPAASESEPDAATPAPAEETPASASSEAAQS